MSTSGGTARGDAVPTPDGRITEPPDAGPVTEPAVPEPTVTEPSDGGPPTIPLNAPRDGLPPVVETAEALAAVVAAFAAGTGPVAVDAERASGYRYSQRAYLVQLRRAGAGTALIDPIACPDLSELGDALAGTEWVLHAANQDLPCLAEIGMRPTSLFDTELAARLLGHPRVGLGTMVATELGLLLEKGHSAADWSNRPLPRDWLVYAALDVEVLVELRDVLAAQLVEQGKTDWAQQEFHAVLTADPPAPRVDPWRRMSGVHRLRSRRLLSGAQALWQVRDSLARERDISPGRILPDKVLVDGVRADPADVESLLAVKGFGGRSTRRQVDRWYRALRSGLDAPAETWPQPSPPGDGPPPAGRWPDRDPAAAARLTRARAVMNDLSEHWSCPVENLLQPEALRRLAWTPLPVVDGRVEPAEVDAVLAGLGAREWQRELAATRLADAVTPRPDDDAAPARRSRGEDQAGAGLDDTTGDSPDGAGSA